MRRGGWFVRRPLVRPVGVSCSAARRRRAAVGGPLGSPRQDGRSRPEGRAQGVLRHPLPRAPRRIRRWRAGRGTGGDPGVTRFDDPGGISYGGIELCTKRCISPLHTHDTTGVLHTEAPANETNTLGEFFVEWGVRLDERCVGGFCEPEAPIAVYVDGEPYGGDPAEIALENLREIAIVIGSFPSEVPSTYDFSSA